MALDDLIARLEQDADAQVAAIAGAADAEVAAIEATATATLTTRTAQTLERERQARLTVNQRALADARRAARSRELAAAHATLDRIFGRALALLPGVADAEAWARVWPELAGEALSYVEGACLIRCTPRIAAVIRPVLAPHGRHTVVEDETVGPGLVMDSADGSLSIDARLSSLLARHRPRLARGLLEPEARDA